MTLNLEEDDLSVEEYCPNESFKQRVEWWARTQVKIQRLKSALHDAGENWAAARRGIFSLNEKLTVAEKRLTEVKIWVVAHRSFLSAGQYQDLLDILDGETP